MRNGEVDQVDDPVAAGVDLVFEAEFCAIAHAVGFVRPDRLDGFDEVVPDFPVRGRAFPSWLKR